MADRSVEDEVIIKLQQARKLARYMSSTQDLVESQIIKAQQRGDFDNLAGAGKPLDLDENPYEPPELRMMFKILKDNDFAPFWVELGKEIDADMKRFSDEVEYFKRYTRMIYQDKHSRAVLERFEKKKANFYFEQRLALERTNKKIINYNLHCPTFQQGRATMAVDNHMFELITQIEQVIEDCLSKKENR